MALASGWSTKAPLTIDHTKVSTNVTDLPIIIVYDNLPSSITNITGGCKEDGSDIRFTADINGITEYPRQIINVDKTNNIVTCYVRIPSISSSVDTTFYIWWDNPNAGEPSEVSASGSKTCWSNYYGVYHFNDMVAGWKGVKDSAGNWVNFTANGTIATSDSHIEGMSSYELSPTFGMNVPEFYTMEEVTNDMSFWVNFRGTYSIGQISEGNAGNSFLKLGFIANGQFGGTSSRSSTTSGAIPASGWHLLSMINTAGVARWYVDGVDVTLKTKTDDMFNFPTFGELTAGLSVSISELRMTRNSNFTQGYYQVMYVNESNPSVFVSSGTPIVVGTSIEITIKVVNEDNVPLETAYVYIDEDDVLPHIMNTTTNVSGLATGTFSGSSVSTSLRVRKYGYKAFKTTLDLGTNDINQTVTMITDPQQI